MGTPLGTRASLLLVATLAAACQAGRPPTATRNHAAMNRAAELVKQVRANDPAATLLARELGPDAAPSLIPLTRDGDEAVREIALLCLAETGGAGAVPAMLAGLNDDAPMVRAAALRGLERRAGPGDAPALVRALEQTADAGTRRYVALLVGSHASAAEVPAVAAACSRYTDAETGEGCVTALAQLDDPAAREEFIRRLTTAKDRALGRYLEYAERIHEAWLVPALAALLADRTPIRWVGVDGLPGPETLRAADIAVNLIAEITGRRFSFETGGRVNYTDGQLAEVRAAVSR